MNLNCNEEFPSFCRVCLQLPETDQILNLDLIYDEEENLSYDECFTICTKIQLEASNTCLPHNLCKTCGLELQFAYDFHKKVEQSKRILEQIEIDETQQQSHEEVSLQILSDYEVYHATEGDDLSKASSDTNVIDRNIVAAEEEALIEEHLILGKFGGIEDIEVEDTETMQPTSDDVPSEEYVVESIALSYCNSNADVKLKENSQRKVPQKYLPVNVVRKKTGNVEITDKACNITLQNFGKVRVESTVANCKRKRHTGTFVCDVCHKIFPNFSRMSIHRRIHEENREKFNCNDCGRLYATKQALDVHIRTAHTKRGYTCEICGKVFAIRKGLIVHMRFHTGTFPYECDLCDKKFAQMCHLNTHKNVKHNSLRFSCEFPNCGKYFTSSNSLRNHEFSHGDMPFECSFCQRGYPAKAKLKSHIRLKHGFEMSCEDLEEMRKFHVARSKLNIVKLTECED